MSLSGNSLKEAIQNGGNIRSILGDEEDFNLIFQDVITPIEEIEKNSEKPYLLAPIAMTDKSEPAKLFSNMLEKITKHVTNAKILAPLYTSQNWFLAKIDIINKKITATLSIFSAKPLSCYTIEQAIKNVNKAAKITTENTPDKREFDACVKKTVIESGTTKIVNAKEISSATDDVLRKRIIDAIKTNAEKTNPEKTNDAELEEFVFGKLKNDQTAQIKFDALMAKKLQDLYREKPDASPTDQAKFLNKVRRSTYIENLGLFAHKPEVPKVILFKPKAKL